MKKTNVLLDLLPDVEPEVVEVAHDSEEKEEKEEIEQGPIKVKRSKKTSEEDDEDSDSKLWQYIKYAGVAGFILLVGLIILHKKGHRKHKPDMQEMMMMMMYQTMIIQMQNMQKQYNHKETLPPQIATDDDTTFSTDWSDWFEENKDKEFKKFGSNKNQVLNKMHVAENWKVRRDLNGKILDVNKTNEYIR